MSKYADLLGIEVEDDQPPLPATRPTQPEPMTPPTNPLHGGHSDSFSTKDGLPKEYNGLSTISFDVEEVMLDEGTHGAKFWDVFQPAEGGSTGGRPAYYEVSFPHGPIGLQLEADYYGTAAIVKGFTSQGGKEAPAQTCRQIRPGDILTHIGTECVLDTPFDTILDLFRSVQGGSFILRFQARGAVRTTFSQSGRGGSIDEGMIEARRAIFEAKARFFMSPFPEDEMIYCSVTRHRGVNVVSFNLHRDDTGEFLLACSLDSNLQGPLVFHTLKDSHLRTMRDIPTSQDCASYLGCMVPNFLGTEFRLMDFRVDPKESSTVEHSEATGAYEVCAIVYNVNVLGRTPNFMKVLLRRPRTGGDASSGGAGARRGSNQGAIKLWETHKRKHTRDLSIGSPMRSLKQIWKSIADDNDQPKNEEDSNYGCVGMEEGSDIMVFETKRPTWNPNVESWVLNFNGRVRIPSKKNFIVCPERGNLAMETEFGEGNSLIRHGKMTKAHFNVDFRHPVPPIVALAVCCSTFSEKRIVT